MINPYHDRLGVSWRLPKPQKWIPGKIAHFDPQKWIPCKNGHIDPKNMGYGVGGWDQYFLNPYVRLRFFPSIYRIII